MSAMARRLSGISSASVFPLVAYMTTRLVKVVSPGAHTLSRELEDLACRPQSNCLDQPKRRIEKQRARDTHASSRHATSERSAGLEQMSVDPLVAQPARDGHAGQPSTEHGDLYALRDWQTLDSLAS